MAENIDILIIEDEPMEAFFLQKAFMSSGSEALFVVQNGDEAIDFLFRRNNYKDAGRPKLILCDINMPGKNGHDVLVAVKESEDLRRIPFIMLSGSSLPDDIQKSYTHYANAYVQKPANFIKMQDFVIALRHFWFSHVHILDQ